MTRRLVLLTAASTLCAAFVLSPGRAQAEFMAYSFGSPITGNQGYTGSLGLDFNVVSPIEIVSLGAFDSNGDGLISTVSVAIFDRGTQSIVGSALTFSGASDTLTGGYRNKATSISLGVGQYSVVAWGFDSTTLNFNTGFPGSGPGPAMNDGGGAIDFVGLARFGAPAGSFPTTIDGGPENRYGAGTFSFVIVPEPTSLALWCAGFLVVGTCVSRRKISQ